MTFLALDPGTYKTGAAVFEDERLVASRLLSAGGRQPLEVRFVVLLNALDALALEYPDIGLVVCERTTAIESRQPAPELQAYIRRLRQWSRQRRCEWVTYHPSTVVKNIRPRSYRPKGENASKLVIALGVKMIYTLAGLDQNVTDAIAVGHCHLSEERVRRMEAI